MAKGKKGLKPLESDTANRILEQMQDGDDNREKKGADVSNTPKAMKNESKIEKTEREPFDSPMSFLITKSMRKDLDILCNLRHQKIAALCRDIFSDVIAKERERIEKYRKLIGD